MLSVTKQFRFEACHYLPYYDGKCHNLHGHSYLLEVTVRGDIVKDTDHPKCGMIIDYKDLKEIVGDSVLKYVDHSNLNELYDNPTAEIMVKDFYERISMALPVNMHLVKCNLWETADNYATYSEDV